MPFETMAYSLLQQSQQDVRKSPDMKARLASRFLVVGLLSGLCLLSARANTIILDGLWSEDCNAWGWKGQSGAPAVSNPTAADLITWLIGSGALQDLYKGESNGGEEFTLSGSYETTFYSGNETATITYEQGPVPGGYVFALAKDGAVHHPAWYVWYLSGPVLLGRSPIGWDGTSPLDFAALWPGEGSFSHVQLMGTPEGIPPSVRVPDGGATAALLGFGMLALGLAARRKA